MRSAIALFVLGSLALGLQSAAATFSPPPYCPDFALLVVLSMGLIWDRASTGLILASLLGYAADLLSGSLLGLHALLRLFVFVGARVASRRMNIRGALPLACFAGVLTIVYGLASVSVTGFFSGAIGLSWNWIGDVLIHASVNALSITTVLKVVELVLRLSADSETGRKPLRFDAREGTA